MTPNEQYEDDLLHDAEGLDLLVKLFQTFDDCLENLLLEYTDDLDPHIVICLELIRFDINLTLSGVVKWKELKIPGLLMELEDVMDTIQVLQAGLKTRSEPSAETKKADPE